MSIKWNDSYSVGIDKIDEQHKKILELLKQVLDDIQNNKFENLKNIIKELVEYSNYHFKTEEDLFDKYDYENKEAHIEKHQEFRAHVMNIAQSYENNELSTSYELHTFLEDWFVDHINGTDKKYVELLKDKEL